MQLTISRKKQSGFTLIELIIVVGILAILAVAIIVVLDPLAQIQKTNDARRKSDLSQIQKTLETYYQDNGRYPDSAIDYKITSIDGVKDWGTSWQPYMNVLPKDPSSSKRYIYYSDPASSGQSYYLYASLDREGKDPQVCNGGADCINVPSVKLCGTTGGIYFCNYGISSPNVSP